MGTALQHTALQQNTGMTFVKVVKNRQYFKRYQTKFRRRREGKTDFKRRGKLTCQDKNKYNSPKYRLVVRITNKDVVCQVVFAKIIGDQTLCAAYAHELPRYGLPVGLTNYAGCYATGLLLARRLLHKLKLDTQYVGKEKADGKLFSVEEALDGPRPFRALLDVGLARTTTGARVFGALRGAIDGGLNVPHSEKRFRGYDPETKKYSADAGRDVIFAKHVSEYMSQMNEEDPEKFKRQFSKYIEKGITADNLESTIAKTHAAIRKSPAHVAKKSKFEGKPKRYARAKRSLAQRKDRVKQKLEAMAAKAAAAE